MVRRDAPNDPFAPGKTPEETARDLLLALRLRADVANSSGIIYFTHHSDVPVVLSLAKDAHVIGPVIFQSSGSLPGAIPPQTIAVEGLGSVTIGLDDNRVSAKLEGGETVIFDVQDAVKELYRGGWPETQDHPRPVEVKGAGNGPASTMVIDNLKGTYKEPEGHLAAARLARARAELGYSAATEAERPSQPSRSASARAARARLRSSPFGPRLP